MTYEPPHAHTTGRSTSRSRSSASPSAHEVRRPLRRPPARFAELRRRRERILLALYLTLGLELVLAVFTSPLLAVHRLQIKGATGLPSSETEATCRMVAMTPGLNWLRAPVREKARDLKSLPWVRQATVRRTFPNSIVVDLTVRQPVLAVYTAFGNYEVDADNTPIRRLRPEMRGKLTAVSLAATSSPHPGSRLNNDGLSAAVHIAQSTQTDSTVRVSKIEVDQSGDIWLNMQNGIRILFGQADELDVKLATLRRLFHQDPSLGTRLSEINLSCPNWPACRLRVATTDSTNGSSIASASERQEAR